MFCMRPIKSRYDDEWQLDLIDRACVRVRIKQVGRPPFYATKPPLACRCNTAIKPGSAVAAIPILFGAGESRRVYLRRFLVAARVRRRRARRSMLLRSPAMVSKADA